MKKGTMTILLGWLLIALQMAVLAGSIPGNGFAELGAFGVIGYCLPGILGIVLLCTGYIKKSRRREAPPDEKPNAAEEIMERIRAGLTGDPAKDRAFLAQQIRIYGDHPMADTIIGGCAKLLANTMSEEELDAWEQARKADDAQIPRGEPRENQSGASAGSAPEKQEKSEPRLTETPAPGDKASPQSDLEFLLSGMRDYQEGSGNPFVLNRIVLGMAETPLYFAVDMGQDRGAEKPDARYILNHARRFLPAGNLIVALTRNEDIPSENTTVKAIPLRLEEYIPILAEKKEPLLLLDPVEGNPVVIPSEMIEGPLLTCAREKLGACPPGVIADEGPEDLLLWQAKDAAISEGVELRVAPNEEAVALVGWQAEYFFQSGTHTLSSAKYPLIFDDAGSILFVRKENSITIPWEKTVPYGLSSHRRIFVLGTCEVRISNTAAFFIGYCRGQAIPDTHDGQEYFLRLMIESVLEPILPSAFSDFEYDIRRIREDESRFAECVHEYLNKSSNLFGLTFLSFRVDRCNVSSGDSLKKEEIRRERRIISGTEEKPEIEVQTVRYDDGSYSEIIHDHIDDRVEILEHDGDGNEMRVYGRFVEYEPVPDEELTRYM